MCNAKKWLYHAQGQQKQQHHGAQERAPGVGMVGCDSAGYRRLTKVVGSDVSHGRASVTVTATVKK